MKKSRPKCIELWCPNLAELNYRGTNYKKRCSSCQKRKEDLTFNKNYRKRVNETDPPRNE
jgi:hypothetical protein